MSAIERWFGVRAAGSTPAREVGAGLATFATLSYILFVQPAVLSACGMDPGGVLFATCVASACACFLMAWWANLPIALAPAMGHNFFFAFAVCQAQGFPWQQALAANLLAGLLFLALALVRFRERVIEALPEHLRQAIAAGIGLLIATIGLEWGGIVVDHPATLVQLGDLTQPAPLLALLGLALCAVLHARGVPGAFLLGILGTAAAGLAAGALFDLERPLVRFEGVVGAPPAPTMAFQLDFAGLFARPPGEWLAVLAVFFALDLFDSIGTLTGVCGRAGLAREGKIPRLGGALAADAAGTAIGAALGTSTVSSYVESAAGVAAGGRTGLTAVVAGLCFLLALVLTPLFATIGAGVAIGAGPAAVTVYPVLAPVLVLVGALMAGALARIRWDDAFEAVPAFLTIVVMQLSISITDGIAWGMVATSLLALASGGRRRAGALVHFLALAFVLRYAFL